MSKKIVVIFGATGKQGGSIINSLLNDPTTKEAFQIRGVTRDPTKDSAKKLKERGIEPVKGDMDNIDELKDAMKGAYGVFAVTNYWETMDKDKEYQQGKNIADAAKETGVQHLIFSSLIDVKKETNGKLPGVFHFDTKNHVEQYIRKEGIPASFFYPGFYMSNLLGGPMGLQKTGDNELTFPVPITKDAQFPLFNVEDTGKWVKAIFKKGLTEDGRKQILGEKVLAATDYYTPVEIVEQAAKVVGKKGIYKEIPDDEFLNNPMLSQMPEFARQELFENMKLLGPEFGYYSKASLKESLELTEEKPSTWEQFFEQAGKANFQ